MDRRWKVLVISQYFHPEQFHINGIARSLAERGHQVTVLTGLPNYPGGAFFDGYRASGPYVEEWAGVRIFRAPLVPRGAATSFRLLLNYLSFALASCAVLVGRVREDFDVVLLYQASPVTVAVPAVLQRVLRKTPVVCWVLDLWPESVVSAGGVKNRRLVRWLETGVGFLLRDFDRVLVQSESFAEPLVARGVARERIEYFPSPADYELSSDEDSPACGLCDLPGAFRVMFAGNIGHAQDFPTILRAAEMCRDDGGAVAWIILGDGRELAAVRREVLERRLTNVHLFGRQPRTSMPEYLSKADALLVSLLPDPDLNRTVPGKIQSYMAAGKPIIGAIGGAGAALIAAAGAGITVQPGDARGLYGAVHALRKRVAADREAMGRRGREYYQQNFTVDAAVDRLEQHLSFAATGGVITKSE